MKQVKSYQPEQSYFIPFNPFESFHPGSLEMTVHHIFEKYISIKPFLKEMKNQKCGQKALSPKILLKIIFYAYSSGIFSSRIIENQLNNNLAFIFLSGYQKIDHSTICRFILKYPAQIRQVFAKVLYICYKNKLVTLDMASLDGSKIRANASSEWTGNQNEFFKLKERLEKRIEKLIERQKRVDKKESSPQQLMKTKLKIERQKRKYQSALTKIEKFINETDNNEVKTKINLTDRDCRLQKGENGKYFEGYNAQVVSNHKFILSYDVTGHQSDRNELLSMIDLTEKNLKHLGLSDSTIKQLLLLADAGYRNTEQIGQLYKRGYNMYIRVNPVKEAKYDKIGTEQCRIFKKGGRKFLRCPGGRILKTKGAVKEHGTYFYKFYASRGGCADCQYREICWGNNKSSKSTTSCKAGGMLPPKRGQGN
jgi:hypothetical protein